MGSGKSTVSRIVREQGYAIIDLDELAHRVIEPGQPAYAKIVSRFGEEILDPDKKINRRELGRQVFPDPEARKELEDLTHPEINRLLQEMIQEYQSSGWAVVFLEIPLLYEVGMDSWVSPVIVVKASEDVCIRRLKEKGEWSEEEIRSRIRSQLDIDEKVRRADFVVDNSGDLENTKNQLVEIIKKIGF